MGPKFYKPLSIRSYQRKIHLSGIMFPLLLQLWYKTFSVTINMIELRPTHMQKWISGLSVKCVLKSIHTIPDCTQTHPEIPGSLTPISIARTSTTDEPTLCHESKQKYEPRRTKPRHTVSATLQARASNILILLVTNNENTNCYTITRSEPVVVLVQLRPGSLAASGNLSIHCTNSGHPARSDGNMTPCDRYS
jgi:hypothetical protein